MRMMRPLLGAATGVAIGLSVVAAFAVTQDFDTFVSGRTAASTPLGSGDKVPVIQGGVTKYLAGNAFAQVGVSQTQANWTISGVSNNLTVLAASQLSGTVPVGNGGTGLTTYTSGGIVCATGSTTLASSVALTVNSPLIGGGAGACPGVGSVTGNTTKFVTNTGSITTGHGGSWDSNGNWVDNANSVFTNQAATFTAQITFGSTIGSSVAEGTTSHTLAPSTECGKTIVFSNSASSTFTAPSTTPANCIVAILQQGAGQVTVTNGGSGNATFNSVDGFSKTFAQWALIGLYFDSNSGGSAAHAVFFGRGV